MKQSTIWTLLIIVVVLAGLVYAVDSVKLNEGTSPLASTTPTSSLPPLTATYYCAGGKTVAATFKQDSAGIVLSDGRSFDLASTLSASGARYETGANTASDVVFWTKGSNAFLTENGNTVLDNCVAGTSEPTSSASGVSVCTDASRLFSFEYPTTLSVSGSQVGYTEGWRQQATTSGMLLAEVIVPKTTQPKTNFSEAKFTVGVSSDPDAVKVCLTDAAGGSVKTGTTVTINGQQFSVLSFSDAGAGNFYETTSYRTVKDNECYAAEYTIHSTNIGNYSPDQGISQFNKGKATAVLEGMVTSFRFLQ